jgi:hypothetical protein
MPVGRGRLVGLWRRLGKAVYPQGYPGFESLSLRQAFKAGSIIVSSGRKT